MKAMPGYLKFGEVVVPVEAIDEIMLTRRPDGTGVVGLSVSFTTTPRPHDEAVKLYDEIERLRAEFSADSELPR